MSLVCCVLIEGFLSSYYTYIGSVGHRTSVGAKMRRFCRVPCHAADKICNNKDFLTTLECNFLDKIKIKTLVVSTFSFFLCYNGKRSDNKRNIVFGVFSVVVKDCVAYAKDDSLLPVMSSSAVTGHSFSCTPLGSSLLTA